MVAGEQVLNRTDVHEALAANSGACITHRTYWGGEQVLGVWEQGCGALIQNNLLLHQAKL